MCVCVYGVSCWLFYFFFCIISRSPNTICWRGYFYSILCSCPLYQTLIDHRDMGLFLGSLFCSIVLCVCSYANSQVFWLQLPCNLVWYRCCDPTYFVLLSENCWGYLGYFRVPYKFLKCFSFFNLFFTFIQLSVKYVISILIWIALNL